MYQQIFWMKFSHGFIDRILYDVYRSSFKKLYVFLKIQYVKEIMLQLSNHKSYYDNISYYHFLNFCNFLLCISAENININTKYF